MNDQPTPPPADALMAEVPPAGVHRYLVTTGDDAKTTFWGLTAAYANWIEGRLNRHDASRETWLVTVFAENGQRFIDSTLEGVTIEEIVGADDTEQYVLRAGEPGTGWAEAGR